MTDHRKPTKREAFESFLREGWVRLHFDARRGDVSVPDRFKGDGHLVLQYGMNMSIPITDLVVDNLGVTATLSFDRAPHMTAVMWPAVFAIVDTHGMGIIWDEDIPSDVKSIQRTDDGPFASQRQSERRLRAIPDDGIRDDDAEPSPPPKGPPKLRLV